MYSRERVKYICIKALNIEVSKRETEKYSHNTSVMELYLQRLLVNTR
jgi:hypothetical protein